MTSSSSSRWCARPGWSACSRRRTNAWRTSLAAHGLLRPDVLRRIAPTTRGVSISKAGLASATPCLPEVRAGAFHGRHAPAARLHRRPHLLHAARRQLRGHALPRAQPLTVHFMFQHSDTPDYPHGSGSARARGCGPPTRRRTLARAASSRSSARSSRRRSASRSSSDSRSGRRSATWPWMRSSARRYATSWRSRRRSTRR